MGGGLVGHEVEVLPSPRQLGHDVGCVSEQADGERAAGARGGTQARERVLQGVGRLVEVARLEPAVDAGLVDLDAEDRRPASVAASGWAPPIPPRPAVRIVRPASEGEPKCFSPAAANVW